MMIQTHCTGCQTALSFPLEQAGATGPCYQCGTPIVVPPPPPITARCAHCGTASEFAYSMLGQSGPCRGCGQQMTVTMAPSPSQAPPPAQPRVQPISHHPAPAHASQAHPPQTATYPAVAPGPLQQKVLATLEKEAAKAGLQVQHHKVIQIGANVTSGESTQSPVLSLWRQGAHGPRAGRPRGRRRRRFLVVIPFSGKFVLSHELASIVPGVLPSNLWLERGLMGDWGTGHYTADGGDEDPVATAAEQATDINEGIVWDWENGRTKMKLQWGLQAIPASPTSTLMVIQTAKLGIIRRTFGLDWFPKRHSALEQFMSDFHSTAPAPHPRFKFEPLSTIFASEFR